MVDVQLNQTQPNRSETSNEKNPKNSTVYYHTKDTFWEEFYPSEWDAVGVSQSPTMVWGYFMNYKMWIVIN